VVLLLGGRIVVPVAVLLLSIELVGT